MNKYLKYYITACVLLLLLQSLLYSQDEIERKKSYQVHHIKIEVKLDLQKKTVDGITTTTVIPLNDNFRSFKVDAAGMDIKNVDLVSKSSKKGESLRYDYDKREITVHLKHAYRTGDTLTYSVKYFTQDPELGIYFIAPDSIFPDKPYQVWTQGEDMDNHYWFPCYDYPNNKATTEIVITVDGKYITLSNGKLMSVKSNSNGTKTWDWKEDKPYSSYLVMLAAGNFDVIEDKWNDIPVESYVPPGEKEIAYKSFDKTADMVKYFSDMIGYKYPWEKYSQIVVKDFVFGGMENVSATVLVSSMVHDHNAEPDYSAYGVVSHELAHQWWGDVVTCSNWNEIWLNEGFATYFADLYDRYINGKDEFDYDIFKEGEASLKADTFSRRPIYTDQPLTANSYDKGSVVLNMIHNLCGERDFWKALNVYITDHQYNNVVTQDLIDAIYKVSVMDPTEDRKPNNMKWFFDEWIYRAGQPEYNVTYDYNKDSNIVHMTVYQQQKVDSTTSIFHDPVPLEIITEKSKLEYTIASNESPKTYTFTLDAPLKSVIFNKGNKVLCKLYFTKPKADWLYQLENSEDAIDRIDAVMGLKDYINDEEVISGLTKSMTSDNYWGVRLEAASMLGFSAPKDIPGIIMQSYASENDSRVRREMLLSLGKLKETQQDASVTNSMLDFVRNAVTADSNYFIIADGIEAISKLAEKDKIYDLLLPYIDRTSHADIIKRAVASALIESKDQRAEDIFIKYAKYGNYPRLKGLAIRGLSEYLSDQKAIDCLNSLLFIKNAFIRRAVISQLEKAGSPSSKPYVEALLKKTYDDETIKSLDAILDKIKIK